MQDWFWPLSRRDVFKSTQSIWNVVPFFLFAYVIFIQDDSATNLIEVCNTITQPQFSYSVIHFLHNPIISLWRGFCYTTQTQHSVNMIICYDDFFILQSMVVYNCPRSVFILKWKEIKQRLKEVDIIDLNPYGNEKASSLP